VTIQPYFVFPSCGGPHYTLIATATVASPAGTAKGWYVAPGRAGNA